MEEVKVKPGKILYIISGIILLAGIIGFVIILFSGISSTVNTIGNRVVVPGSKEIVLDEPGKYTIYLESRSVVDGKVYERSGSVDGLICSLLSIEDEQYIKLNNSTMNSSYTMPNHEGRSIFSFEINTPGKYRLKGWFEDEEDSNKVVLAVGKGFGTKLATTILSSIGIIFGSIFLSLGLFIFTFIKRRRIIEKKAEV